MEPKSDQIATVLEEKKDAPEAAAEQPAQSSKSFFDNADNDFSSFMSHMKTPKKEVATPPGFDEDDDNPDGDDGMSQQEKEEMLQYMDYTPAHLRNAQFWLIQVDKVMALAASFISGLPAQKYRQRLEKPAGEDYEAEILAALIKKYQMSLSLEGMFITAMVLAYGPVLYDANQDRQKVRQMYAKQQEHQQRHQTDPETEPDMPRINPNRKKA